MSFVVLAAAITLGVIYINSNSVKATTVSFSFGSGGDHGNHADAQSVFEAAGLSGIDFFQTNGDLSYLDSPTSNTATATTEWCSMVNSKLGSIPFLTLNGNHEEPGAHTGLDGDNIDDVIAPGCLPKPASMNVVESPNKTGTLGTTPTNYGREYYYDYPAVNPIARFIAVSADIKTYVGGDYDYTVGSSHYNWVQARVQEAKLSGMWVVVINHTPTMNTGGSHGGTDYSTVTPLFNMLIDENVDLILSGHEHNYQRSKQIGGASCDYVFNTYSSSCMANSSTSSYTAGNGPIIVITGSTGGNYTTGDGNMVAINSSDPDYPYFAATMGYGSPNATKGFSKFDVTDTSITGHFVPGVGQTGGFTDTFTITRPDTTAPTVTLDTPSAGTVSGTVSMTATASDAVGVTKVEFYQGATKLGEDLSSPYAYSWDSTTVANGNYSLTAKALDAAGNIGTSNTVYVTVSNGSGATPVTSFTMAGPSSSSITFTTSGQCSSITSHTIADTTKAPSGQTLLVGAEFSLSCAAASNTATIVIGLGASYDTSKLRVHKLAGTTLTDITSLVTFGTSGGYTTVSYTVTDGGFGDEDSSSNAIIDDPIYVTNVAGVSTVNTTTLANTGIDSILLISVAVGMIGFGLIGALTIGYKRVNR
ncbi:MAG: Ig-like domain-containing protein [Candidatus Saccharimonadales bacterium]